MVGLYHSKVPSQGQVPNFGNALAQALLYVMTCQRSFCVSNGQDPPHHTKKKQQALMKM
jgi:hypothetical protein